MPAATSSTRPQPTRPTRPPPRPTVPYEHPLGKRLEPGRTDPCSGDRTAARRPGRPFGRVRNLERRRVHREPGATRVTSDRDERSTRALAGRPGRHPARLRAVRTTRTPATPRVAAAAGSDADDGRGGRRHERRRDGLEHVDDGGADDDGRPGDLARRPHVPVDGRSRATSSSTARRSSSRSTATNIAAAGGCNQIALDVVAGRRRPRRRPSRR